MSGLLENLSHIAKQLGLAYAVSCYTDSPAPDTYLVFTPLTDSFEIFADNTPGIEVEEVRIALFTKTNYLGLRNQLTRALIDAGLTVTARRYIGYEADTGFHHYSIDVSSFRACP
ncbi:MULTISPECIES: hypothetical protein [Actinomycetaceae]|uniref:Uncharacterized protein n=2 Tax=Mobiluncus curtisii TaxID=2051 RepID=D6ZFZ4_MOBCV|nr:MULTISPECIES: hypothetical protein [Actinomycetaceae]ADI67552.1 hypothetical protein HMPREF0573_11233 [Mobiluncus curtisii ATCC 43063]NMW45359.1 hypothetical protein [Mobiluncus curtisii]QQU08737.1 hypothetical protein I6I85_00670 [Mobiluncus curtisii]WIK58728.1 hypothetical protein CJ184_005565 [Actinotignum urinale]SQB65156.1 Uncharacterised protein [Mobiluncus curtisii]